MAQFIQYSSTDASGPGALTGTVGSLLTVLDACLVNGYAGKAAAGWSKPVANASNIGCYKQGGGSQFGLVINDNAPNATPAAREAWGIGWKSVTGVGSPIGSGTGQFPLASQILSGNVMIRKSATADSTPRSWTLYADDRTFYLFIHSGDTAGIYFDFGFGDFFSLWGNTDTNRCFICGRTNLSNAVVNTGNGGLDLSTNPAQTSNFGMYLADNFGGTAGSIPGMKCGDIAKQTGSIAAGTGLPLLGNLPTPNSADNSYYLSPLWIMETSWLQRGRMRGLYHVCHPLANFSDGQVFSGSNDFAGKTFVVLVGGSSGGMHCVETSATLETN